KPSVKFFHIFGFVCYIVRDGENLDKMKEKGDECIFVGRELTESTTRVIMESIHVNFDELPQMASVQNSSDPAPTCQTMASVQISSDPAPECQTMALKHDSLSPGRNCQENVSHGDKTDQNSSDPAPECQTMELNHDCLSPAIQRQRKVTQADRTVTTSNELDLLFSLMFDELLNGSSKVVSKSSAVSAADAPNQRQQLTTPLTNHTTPAPTCQIPNLAPTVISSENINQAETYAENDQVADDEFINIFSTPIQDQGEMSLRHVDSSNMHTFYQRYPSEHRWTKDHPLEQVIGNHSQSIRTRRQLESDAQMCTTLNELDLLFSPMFDELLNGSSKVVSKSSVVSAADALNQRQQPTTPLINHTTPAPICQNPFIASSVTSNENINQAEQYAENDEIADDEFINIFSTPGIKREFSNARNPQQNGVAERRNRTLIEAARTMLADAKLPVTFWAEAVDTASYVQNKVLVNKSQNKTPYELFNGRTPAIGFLKPFGCHVMILNTLDNLGKFEAKGDEGYFIGYSMSSKAFRVFNKRTKRVEENLHVEFLENKAIEKSAGPNWLFDIDSLNKSLNYVSVDAHDALLESSSSKPHFESSTQVLEGSGNLNPTVSSSNPPANQMETLTLESLIPTVSSPVPTACLNDSSEPSSEARLISKIVANQEETPSLDNILSLTNRFEDILRVTTSSDEAIGVEADVSNMETTISASPTPTLRIHKDHPKSQIIEPKKVSDALQDLSWVEAMQEELLQFKIQKVWTLVDYPKWVTPIGIKWVLKNKKDERGIVVRNKARLMDVKSAFIYGTIDEEVYVMQPPGFQDPTFPAKTIVATSTTEAEYVADASCCGQVLWIQNQLLDYGIHTAKTFDLVWIWLGGDYVIKMARLQFCDYHNMVAILEKGEFNSDFHPMVDFIAASPLRIKTTDEGTYILATVDGIQRTVSESSLRRNLKLRDEDGIVSIPDTELFENLTLMGVMASEKTHMVIKEVEEWVKAGIVRPVKYLTWISNPVLVKKSDNGWRMCIDFKNLNSACPKDYYPLPDIDGKIESVVGFRYKCFLDEYKGYHQVYMAQDNEEKMTFYTYQGTYCYTKMPFGLKNAGSTYQRLVDTAFQSHIGRNLEAYVDDMFIKSNNEKVLIADIVETFDNLRRIIMKLNPKKCSLGVEEGKFFGYMVPSPYQSHNGPATQADTKQSPSIRETGQILGRFKSIQHSLQAKKHHKRSGTGRLLVGGSGRNPPRRVLSPTGLDEPAFPVRDDSQGEACPTDSGFIAD
nr:reverse transcriptase domain-containing protein [Tanacetum cinerariifolium]